MLILQEYLSSRYSNTVVRGARFSVLEHLLWASYVKQASRKIGLESDFPPTL